MIWVTGIHFIIFLTLLILTGLFISCHHNITVQHITGQRAGLPQIFHRSGSHCASSWRRFNPTRHISSRLGFIKSAIFRRRNITSLLDVSDRWRRQGWIASGMRTSGTTRRSRDPQRNFRFDRRSPTVMMTSISLILSRSWLIFRRTAGSGLRSRRLVGVRDGYCLVSRIHHVHWLLIGY